ncbi:MAG TPA: GldG family protein [Opitutaceae bacterium]|nr:GldG family protein [Opitutaceae bacterium]
MPSAESFRTVRWVRTANLLLQALLVLTLFLGLSYLARRHSWRYDLIANRRYALSPETQSYLRQLAQPVRIVVTFDEGSDDAELAIIAHDVDNLLSEYAFATRANDAGRVSFEHLDVYQQRREAEQLGIDQVGDILVICGEKHRVLHLNELYEFKNKRRTAFLGEQAFTAAILDVANAGQKKIYFLSGHGEQRPDDVDPVRGLSLLGDELRHRNFDVKLLDLTVTNKVPDDAALLIAAGPRGTFDRFEQEQLRQFLSIRAGRLILLIDPGRPFGLDSLLADWGVVADDDLICDTGAKNMTDDGDLMLWNYNSHPVTQVLIDNNLHLRLGPARSVRADPSRILDDSLTVTCLASTSTTAWGYRDYRRPSLPTFTPGIDLKGTAQTKNCLGIIAASERVTARGASGEALPLSVRGGRLIVCGTSELVTNNRLVNAGNQNLVLAAINWAADRDTQLVIPARPIERYQISLSTLSLAKLRLGLLLLPPAVAALLGLFVYWTRRR